ncbi:hypothetical protein PIB30_114730, partial [Stylosanthes scabra]|nr:hypothetical protein [Stylosanthes scabra]
MANKVLFIGNLLFVFGLAVTAVTFFAWVYKFGIVASETQPVYTQPQQDDPEGSTDEHDNTQR